MRREQVKPRILLLHYSAPPIIGGVENVLAQHARLFRAANYPVTLVTGRGGNAPPFVDTNVVVIPELDSQHPAMVEITRWLKDGIVASDLTEFENEIVSRLTPYCKESDVVIAHNVLHYHFNLPLTAALHRLLNDGTIKNLLSWCHDISRFVNPSSGETLRYGFPWDLLRTFHPLVTYAAVSTLRQKQLAATLGCSPEAIHVVPNGVDPIALLGLSRLGQRLISEFELLDSDLVLLMPVRITRAKNIEFAMRVVEHLTNEGLKVRLVLTGPPDPHAPDGTSYFEQLLDLRDALDLEQEVRFVYEGLSDSPLPLEIDDHTVGELYRVCDLVLMPSHREGFGLPIFEAGLVGKPIFATLVPAVAEIGDEAVHSIKPGESPVDVARRIKNWADRNPTALSRRRVRRQYTWSNLFTSTIEPLVEQCVEPKELVK